MPRPKIDPTAKKVTTSITLTPDQLQLLRWAAKESGESTSALVGRLITAEAQRITKRTGREPKPAWTPQDQTAATSVRNLLKGKEKQT